MNALDKIKERVRHLYETAPEIHVSVAMTHPKVVVEKGAAVIRGVYPKIFLIEETSSGHTRRHSIPYTDLVIGQVKIEEL